MNSPWSLSFVDARYALITEKSGNIKILDLETKTIKVIQHNLNILEDGQGGLLDILYKDNFCFISYSENRSSGMSSTSVAKAKFSKKKLFLKIYFKLNRL